MKSKLVILSLLLAGASVTATAQTKEKYYSESWKDNFFISVGGGVQANVNKHNFKHGSNLTDVITPNITISLGKLITPVWGVRGQAAGIWGTINSDYGHRGTYDHVDKNFATLHLDGLFNISNALGGYNPKRLFTLSAFAGPGLTFAKGTYDKDKIKVLINGSVGLMGQFHVSKYVDINIEARGEVAATPYGKFSSADTDGAVSLTAGLSYTFGGKKFVTCGAKVDNTSINDELNKYRKALADAEAELAAARRALANQKPTTTVTDTKEITVAGPRAIFFQIGKTNIDDYGLVNIQLAAKIIKANPDKKYKVAGYADKATGNSSWNQKLSEKRAQNVYDALIKEGVSSSQLEFVGFGGTANMFGKNMLNRVVILE